MTVDLLLLFLARSGALLCVTLLLSSALRKYPAIRLAGCRMALVAMVALAITLPWNGLPRQENPSVEVAWQPFASTAVSVASGVVGVASPAGINHRALTMRDAAEDLRVSKDDPSPFAIRLWWSGVLLMACRLLFGVVSLRRTGFESWQVTDQRVLSLLRKICADARVPLPRVVEGESVLNPFVSGAFRPAIYLPCGWYEDKDEETVHAVLRHEVAHIAGGDLRWGLAYRVLLVLFWPQLLLWLIEKPMTTAEEELCDRRVLASGMPDHRYAACLLRLKEQMGKQQVPFLGIGAVSGRSSLAGRVEAILDSRRAGTFEVSLVNKLVALAAALVVAAWGTVAIARSLPEDRAARGAYETTISVLADGKPVRNCEAWVDALGPGTGHVVRQLKVVDGEVIVPKIFPSHSFGVCHFWVRAPGRGLGVALLWPAKHKVTSLELPVACTYSGHLIGSDHQPVANMAICLDRVSTAEATASMLGVKDKAVLAITDASGTFTFRDMPPDAQLTLRANDKRYYLNYNQGLTQRSPNEYEYLERFTLEDACSIRGTVRRNGHGVSGVTIEASVRRPDKQSHVYVGGAAVTGPDGRYVIDGIGSGIGDVEVWVPKPLNDEVTAVAREGITLQPGDHLEHVDFALIPGAVVEGSLWGPLGQLLPGRMVSIQGPGHSRLDRMTDAQGRYRFVVPPGVQKLFTNSIRHEAKTEFTVRDGENAHVDLHMELARWPSTDRGINRDEDKIETVDWSSDGVLGTPADPMTPVKLQSGVIAQVVYVQYGNSIWAPDGGVIDGALLSKYPPLRLSATNRNRLVMCVGLQNVNTDSYSFKACLPPVVVGGVGRPLSAFGAATDHVFIGLNGLSQHQVATVACGIASEFFQRSMWASWNQPPFYMQSWPPHPQEFMIMPEEWGKGQVDLLLEIPTWCLAMDRKVVAMDANGGHFVQESSSTEPLTNKSERSVVGRFGFSGGDTRMVDHAEVWLRNYEWITFRGIHLSPNH